MKSMMMPSLDDDPADNEAANESENDPRRQWHPDLQQLRERRASRRRSQDIDRTRAMCGSVPTRRATACFNGDLNQPTEIHMYIGSGILGTILIIALIVYLLRRA